MMNRFISFVVILFATSFTTTSTLNCPDPELILPCQCSRRSVNCKDVSSMSFVRNLLEHLGNEPIQKLSITGVNSSLPPRALGNLSVVRLYILDSNVRYIDNQAFQNQRLTVLALNNISLPEFPTEAVKHITGLENLALVGNFYTRIPYGSLNTLTNLKRLILNQNRLSIIDKDAFPEHLQFLHVERNFLDTFNGSLHSLRELKELWALDNRLTNIDGEFEGLEKLTELYLPGNKIQKLGKSVNSLPKLKILNLSNNRLSTIYKDAFPKHLKSLVLSGNLLKTFNESLHFLSELKELTASNNRLTSIDGEFEGLISLEILNLNRNYLLEIPKSLRDMEKLKELSLSGNKIKEVGKSLNSLTKLTFLNLSHNKITELNWKIFNKMKDLSVLDLSGNYLKVICPTLKPLKFMRELILSDINLKFLEPDCFQNMKMLRKLDISYNRLPVVEAVFQHPLPDLMYLHLDHNLLSDFNYDMKYLNNLRTFDLGFNNISSLKEDTFAHNRLLFKFKMEGNPWECTDEMRLLLRDLEQREEPVHVEIQGRPDC